MDVLNIYAVTRFKDSNGKQWTVLGNYGLLFFVIDSERNERTVHAEFIESGYDHE